jgi:hypothetical protein
VRRFRLAAARPPLDRRSTRLASNLLAASRVIGPDVPGSIYSLLRLQQANVSNLATRAPPRPNLYLDPVPPSHPALDLHATRLHRYSRPALALLASPLPHPLFYGPALALLAFFPPLAAPALLWPEPRRIFDDLAPVPPLPRSILHATRASLLFSDRPSLLSLPPDLAPPPFLLWPKCREAQGAYV